MLNVWPSQAVTTPSGNTPAGVVSSPDRRSSSGRVPARPKRAGCGPRWQRHAPSSVRTATSTVPLVAAKLDVCITTNWRTAGWRALKAASVVMSQVAPVANGTSRSAGVDAEPGPPPTGRRRRPRRTRPSPATPRRRRPGQASHQCRGRSPLGNNQGVEAVSTDEVAAARAAIATARRVVVLTGAGISTDSGIPDFRGPNGVWTRNPAAEKASNIQNYLARPGRSPRRVANPRRRPARGRPSRTPVTVRSSSSSARASCTRS